MRMLEAQGYSCTRAAASLGVWDVIAIGPHDIRAIQVKSGGARCSRIEREQMALFRCPENVRREIWRWPDRARLPLVEVL